MLTPAHIVAFACGDLGPALVSGEVGELHRTVLNLLYWLTSFAEEMKLAVFFETAVQLARSQLPLCGYLNERKAP